MDRPWVLQVPEGRGKQGKMEKTGCKIICGAPMTFAVKRLMMMMMIMMKHCNRQTVWLPIILKLVYRVVWSVSSVDKWDHFAGVCSLCVWLTQFHNWTLVFRKTHRVSHSRREGAADHMALRSNLKENIIILVITVEPLMSDHHHERLPSVKNAFVKPPPSSFHVNEPFTDVHLCFKTTLRENYSP